MANLPLTEIVIPDSEDVLELAPDLSDEVTALQGAVNTLNTDVSNIPNGTYPNLTAGSILTDKYDADTTPYLYRAMPYKSKRLEDVIVGGSVVWNQLAKFNARTGTVSGISYTVASDGTVTLSAGTTTGVIGFNADVSFTGKNGHVIYISGCPSGGADGYYYIRDGYEAGSRNLDIGNGVIVKKTNDNLIAQIYVGSGKTIPTLEFKPQVTDLTQMFGSTIADYVYSLEQATTGSGVAWLKSYGFFTKPYYDYDTGTIKSVEATAHVTYDADDNVIGNYPLGDVTLRGIPKLVNNELVYDGDIYKYDGTVTRNYVLVDVSTLTFTTRYTGNTKKLVSANIGGYYKVTDPGMMCEKYPYIRAISGSAVLSDVDNATYGCYSYNGGTHDYSFYIVLPKDETPSGYVLYKAETPTTETTTPFEQYQVCETGGTEEYTTTNDVPVGHETKYFTDVIGNIENIPAPPTTNGTYTLKVTVSASGNTYAWV